MIEIGSFSDSSGLLVTVQLTSLVLSVVTYTCGEKITNKRGIVSPNYGGNNVAIPNYGENRANYNSGYSTGLIVQHPVGHHVGHGLGQSITQSITNSHNFGQTRYGLGNTIDHAINNIDHSIGTRMHNIGQNFGNSFDHNVEQNVGQNIKQIISYSQNPAQITTGQAPTNNIKYIAGYNSRQNIGLNFGHGAGRSTDYASNNLANLNLGHDVRNNVRYNEGHSIGHTTSYIPEQIVATQQVTSSPEVSSTSYGVNSGSYEIRSGSHGLSGYSNHPIINTDSANSNSFEAGTVAINTINQAVPYPAPYTMTVNRPYPAPVPHAVPDEAPQTVAISVPQSYPVTISKPYPITVNKAVPVHVPIGKAYPVVQHVRIPKPQSYPVTVSQPVAVRAPTPVEANIHQPLYVGSGGASAETGVAGVGRGNTAGYDRNVEGGRGELPSGGHGYSYSHGTRAGSAISYTKVSSGSHMFKD